MDVYEGRPPFTCILGYKPELSCTVHMPYQRRKKKATMLLPLVHSYVAGKFSQIVILSADTYVLCIPYERCKKKAMDAVTFAM